MQALTEWKKGSELEAMRRFFEENGASNKDPADYLYSEIYRTRIAGRMKIEEEGVEKKDYPKDFVNADKKFDRETKDAVFGDEEDEDGGDVSDASV